MATIVKNRILIETGLGSFIELSPKASINFTLVGDIDHVYNGGAIVITDSDGAFLSNVLLKVGSLVTFEFELSDKTFEQVTLAVISMEKDPNTKLSAVSTGGGDYIFTLINPVFFKQIPATRGYFDKTSEIIKKELALITSYRFPSATVADSDDLKSRRYLIGERPLGFIKRIAAQSMIEGTGSICYCDEFGRFKYQSMKKLFDKEPTHSLIAPKSNAITTKTRLLANSIDVTHFKDVNSWDTLKLKKNIFITETNKTEVSIDQGPVKKGVAFVEKNYVDAMSYTTQYSNLLHGTYEQRAEMQQKKLSQMFNFQVEVEASNVIGILSVGSIVELAIEDSQGISENNSYSGTYVVYRCEHGMHDGKISSKLTLVKPSTSKSSKAIGNYFSYGTG